MFIKREYMVSTANQIGRGSRLFKGSKCWFDPFPHFPKTKCLYLNGD